MTMGATWDVNIARQYGAACGAEQRGKGMQVMLGPGVCRQSVASLLRT